MFLRRNKREHEEIYEALEAYEQETLELRRRLERLERESKLFEHEFEQHLQERGATV